MVDTLTGHWESAADTPALPRDEVVARLEALNGTGVPLEVVEGDGATHGELVKRWKISPGS